MECLLEKNKTYMVFAQVDWNEEMTKFNNKQFCYTSYGEDEINFENETLFHDESEFIRATISSV